MKMTPTQSKDAALYKAVWTIGALWMFTGQLAEGECKCGYGEFTDGVTCDACTALYLSELAEQALSECEKAYEIGKKTNFLGKPKRKHVC